MKLLLVYLLVAVALAQVFANEDGASTEPPATKPAAAASEASTTKNPATPSRGARKFQPGPDSGNEVGGKSSKAQNGHDDRSYNFAYQTMDGQKRDEEVKVTHMGEDDEDLVVKGHYSFESDDGFEYIFKYIADERGFRPVITVKRIDT